MKARRQGFTLVEVLVAMGIIALLLTVAVVAYRGLTTSGKVNQTRITINAVQGMFAGFEREKSLSTVDAFNPNRKPLKYPFPYPAPDKTLKPVDLTRSVEVIQALTRIPDNRKALQQLPSQAVKTPVAINPDVANSLPETSRSQSLPVDAWGQMLIFAPAEGLKEVTVAKVKMDVLTAPDHRPFIASAGPDGDFRTGDDNIYSFQP